MRFKDAVWAASDPPRRSAAARHSAGASMSAGGPTRPPNFVAAAAELASIADADEASRGPDGRPHHPGDRCSPTTGRRG
jgi:hypothetical protein